MENAEIIEVIKEWQYSFALQIGIVPRALKPLKPNPSLITVIQGVRRCGKSTFLKQIVDILQLNLKNVVYVNFEDPRFSGILNHSLLEKIKKSCQVLLEKEEPVYFFFDEIQNVQNWEKWLNIQLELKTQNCFVVTGSNAAMLSGELSTSLTGRYLKQELFPFDFFEAKYLKPELNFVDFFKQGGFPLALASENSAPLLRQYFDDIIEKDVRARVGARSTIPLRKLVQRVFESCGSETSARKLAALTELSADTVSSYLVACENAYLVFSCEFFSYSSLQSEKRNKKYYPIDTGLKKAVCTKTGNDLGKDLENIVFLTLRKKFAKVCYWKGIGEVDFVVETEKGIVPIQVSVGKIEERHEKALEEFYRSFPHAQNSQYVSLETFHEWQSQL